MKELRLFPYPALGRAASQRQLAGPINPKVSVGGIADMAVSGTAG